MQASYTLDTKIEALNLLDRHDGDFHRVRPLLEIPLKTLRGWRVDQDKLRRRYEDRQYRHFANIKLELLKDMFETSRDIMKKIKSGDHEGTAVSQLAYARPPCSIRPINSKTVLKICRRTRKIKRKKPTASDMPTTITPRMTRPKQLEILSSPARLKTLAYGPRWRKSALGPIKILKAPRLER